MREVSIVIPVYNEAVLLEKEIERMTAEIQKLFPDLEYEIFLVENGSTDDTKLIITKLSNTYPRLRSAQLLKPDYGQALRHAILKSNGKFIAVFNVDFWDTDFLKQALDKIHHENCDIIVGSKAMKGAGDKRPWSRRLVTRGFNTILKVLFGFEGTDTHGIKVLKSDTVLPIARACETDRVIFDTELILRAQKEGLKTIEIPVSCEEKRKTRLPIFRSISHTLSDLGRLFFVFHRPKFTKGQWVVLGLITIFFLGSIAYGFPDSPSPWFDEGVNLGIAKTFVEDGVYSLRMGAGEFVQERGLMISTNYPVLAPLIVSFKLFGVGMWQAKLVMALFLSIFLFLIFKYVSRTSSRGMAFASLALVITFLPFYGNGLSGGLGEVPGLVFFISGLLLLEHKTKKTWYIFFTGIILGICASTKVFYLTSLFGVGVSEIWFAWKERRVPLARWAWFGLGVLIPLVVWLKTLIPDGFSIGEIARTLAYYNNPYQVEHTLLNNLSKFFTDSTLIHFSMLAIFFFVSLAFRYKNKKMSRSDIIIGCFVILNIVWFLKTPGWFRYIFPAHLLLLVLFPRSLFILIEHFKWNKKFSSVLIALLLLAQTLHFFQNRTIRLYYNPAPRQFAGYLDETIEKNATIYFVDQPELWFLSTLPRSAQYLHMNPHVAFGTDFLNQKELPKYIVVNNPEENVYIRAHVEIFENKYQKIKGFDSYQLFSLK